MNGRESPAQVENFIGDGSEREEELKELHLRGDDSNVQ